MIAAVHSPARLAAVWAAPTTIQAMRSNLKMGRSIRCHLFDPAARDRTLSVHALLYGKTYRLKQTPVLSRHNPRKVRESRQTASGYTKRARAETGMARFKQAIGHGLRSHTNERQATEVEIAVHVLNRMLVLGRPNSVRIV